MHFNECLKQISFGIITSDCRGVCNSWIEFQIVATYLHFVVRSSYSAFNLHFSHSTPDGIFLCYQQIFFFYLLLMATNWAELKMLPYVYPLKLSFISTNIKSIPQSTISSNWTHFELKISTRTDLNSKRVQISFKPRTQSLNSKFEFNSNSLWAQISNSISLSSSFEF